MDIKFMCKKKQNPLKYDLVYLYETLSCTLSLFTRLFERDIVQYSSRIYLLLVRHFLLYSFSIYLLLCKTFSPAYFVYLPAPFVRHFLPHIFHI